MNNTEKHFTELSKFKRYYFQNEILCGNCTGEGCKVCLKGVTPFDWFVGTRKGDLIYVRLRYRLCLNELFNN